MFDKLIESNMAEAEFKPRRKFFMMSSVVVGILFLSAVVFSLYAQNIDLGTDNFEMAELLAPVAADAPEPVQPRPQSQQNDQQETSESPSRNDLIARIDQATKAPTTISTTPFTGKTIPVGEFNFNPNGPNADGIGPKGPPSTGGGSPSRTGEADDITVAEVTKVPEPPPAVSRVPKAPRSGGVVNGKATYLPKPPYPTPAKAVGAEGVVNVQVTIDENGNVISSKAVSGHPLLRNAAEAAASRAKFSKTLLTGVPVKVTGIIVFNFKKS
jgi:periplasmic protein TonB